MGGGQKMSALLSFNMFIAMFLMSYNHQMGLFLSLKITSTFDAPGVCVDIKIQVINVHVYIVARRFEHDKYRLIPRTSLHTVDFLSSARNWYPWTENYRFYFQTILINWIIWNYNKKDALDFKFSRFESREQNWIVPA